MIFLSIIQLLIVYLLVISTTNIHQGQYFMGVSIPVSAFKDPEIKNLKSRFIKQNTIVLIILSIGSFFVQNNIITALSPMFLYALFVVIFFIDCFEKVKKIKQNQNWQEKYETTKVFIDTSFKTKLKVVSSGYYLGLIGLITIILLYIVQIFNQLPDMLASQLDLTGEGLAIAPKMNVLFYLFATIYGVILLFWGINFSLKKVKQNLAPANPQASAKSNLKYLSKSSIYLYYLLLVIITQFLNELLLIVEISTPLNYQIISIICTLISIIIVFRLYQAIRNRDQSSEIETDIITTDENWYWGTFYINKDDPAIFLEKRIGIGWTINLGNKYGLLIVAVFIFVVGISLTFFQ
ncbi:MAG: DUF5808 domain-containing protein [Mycoplasmatales bacterium]